MRVIIIGAGEVGVHAAQLLSGQNHDVIDQDAERITQISGQLDAMVIQGNGASPKLLVEQVGIKKSDLVDEEAEAHPPEDPNESRREVVSWRLLAEESGEDHQQKEPDRD